MYPWYGYHVSSILTVGSMSIEAILAIAVLFFVLAPILSGEGQALGSEDKESTDPKESDD